MITVEPGHTYDLDELDAPKVRPRQTKRAAQFCDLGDKIIVYFRKNKYTVL